MTKNYVEKCQFRIHFLLMMMMMMMVMMMMMTSIYCHDENVDADEDTNKAEDNVLSNSHNDEHMLNIKCKCKV